MNLKHCVLCKEWKPNNCPFKLCNNKGTEMRGGWIKLSKLLSGETEVSGDCGKCW